MRRYLVEMDENLASLFKNSGLVKVIETSADFEQEPELTDALHRSGTDPFSILRSVAHHYAGFRSNKRGEFDQHREVHLPVMGQFDGLNKLHSSKAHGPILEPAFDGYHASEVEDDDTGELKHTKVRLTPNAVNLAYRMIS
jgi:hypothetical protein